MDWLIATNCQLGRVIPNRFLFQHFEDWQSNWSISSGRFSSVHTAVDSNFCCTKRLRWFQVLRTFWDLKFPKTANSPTSGFSGKNFFRFKQNRLVFCFSILDYSPQLYFTIKTSKNKFFRFKQNRLVFCFSILDYSPRCISPSKRPKEKVSIIST